MPLLKPVSSGWRGVCLIAITYVYFLIFAQFAFLKRLALLWIADDHLKAAMAAMAFGGILFSLLLRQEWPDSPRPLCGCAPASPRVARQRQCLCRR